MAKCAETDFEELRALQKRLENLQTDLAGFCEAASKELAARLLALVIPRTPVGKKPEAEGDTLESAVGASGKTKSFLTAEGERLSRYWDGYIGGTLRRGWTAGKEAAPGVYAKSLAVEKSGNYYIIRVINPVEYASYVEFGHRQTPGRYVPALGKQLKRGWVDGQYMLTLSEDDLARIAPAMLQKKLDRFLREALYGEN